MALTAVVVTDSVAVSRNVSSQSQASGRSQVSTELCPSLVVNLVETSPMPRIRSRPEIVGEVSDGCEAPTCHQPRSSSFPESTGDR